MLADGLSVLRCCRHPFLILVNFIATLVTAISLGLVFRNVGVDTPGIQNRSGWAAAAQLQEGLHQGHNCMWKHTHRTQLHVDNCHTCSCTWAPVAATAFHASGTRVTYDSMPSAAFRCILTSVWLS